MGADGITNTDFPRANNLREDALAIIEHQLTETLADRIHFGAGIARRVEQEHSLADSTSRPMRLMRFIPNVSMLARTEPGGRD